MSTDRAPPRATTDASLWASACVILAVILAMAARPGGSAAKAEMVSAAGGFTIMTANGGTDEVLLVLDDRNEELYVYRVSNNAVEFAAKQSLSKLFMDARASARTP
ncbi:MAG: hypothetical protein H6811_03235 [Phycisphaeraceae bacterium]|nr:hypothetical protein [Phycisphaeraceae bacterium]